MSDFHEYLKGDFDFYGEAGREYYNLLAYMSTLFTDEGLLIDIGTMREEDFRRAIS